MEAKDGICLLKLFNERAEEISQGRFVRDLPKNGRLFIGQKITENGIVEEKNIPDVEG